MKTSASGTLYTWNLTTDTNPNVHGSTTVADVGAGTHKVWTFQTTAGPPFAGLATTYEEHGTSSTLLHKNYTWTQDTAGNVYLVTVVTTQDPGTAYAAQTKTTQALDTYGNVQVSYAYDYGNLNTPARTYSYSYITDPNYTSRYIRNRLLSATVTPSGGSAMTLSANHYDYYVSNSDRLCPSGYAGWNPALQDQPGLTLHDSAYSVNFTYRGNPTYISRLNDVHCYGYAINGAVYMAEDGAGSQVNASLSASTNYSLPGVLTPNGNSNLSTSVSYSSFFAVNSLVGPNGATTTTNYDSYGRPSSTSIPDGATTTYTYTYNPNVQTATLTDAAGTRWTKTTYDGFGRTISVVKGHDNAVPVSEVDTQYAPCACSPLGKMSRVSQPYASGATPVWTTYTYDGSGRPLTVTAADGSVTQYLYQGNNTTVTDPAGKWKTDTTDAFGNLTVVTEPRPGGGTNYLSYYTYNGVNQLTSVQLVRDGVTQQRTFQWSGADLASATNPENGTVTYTYDGAHHVLTRTDAKQQVTGYSYDVYGRLTAVAHYPTGVANGADPNQQVTYYYDTYNDPIATNTWGRLAAVVFGGACPANANTTGGFYIYGYNPAGRVTGEKMGASVTTFASTQCIAYGSEQTASYGWDNEGRMTSLIYPGNTNSLTYTYDAMGRLTGMSDSVTITTASAAYGAASEIDSLNVGCGGCVGFIQSFTYNSLWQLTATSVNAGYGCAGPCVPLNMQYVYPAGQNNGRISQAIDLAANQTVNYTYDSLNRLATAQAKDASWGNAYTYDGFGNLTAKTMTAGSAPYFYTSYNPATNQPYPGTTPYVDANGNALYGPPASAITYSYDVENRVVVASQNGSPTIYAYDPQDKRVLVQTSSGGVTSRAFTFYGVTGQRLATATMTCSSGTACTSSQSPGYIYFGGKLISGPDGAVLTDRLGSVRMRNATPNFEYTGTAISYYPWGEEKTSTQDDQVKFATYFRDMPGQDYADQRYYTATAGRFYTPDPSTAVDFQNPVTWNKYVYAGDDPINFRDPRGLMRCLTCDDEGGGDGPAPDFGGPSGPPSDPPFPSDPGPGGGSGIAPIPGSTDTGGKPRSAADRTRDLLWMQKGWTALKAFRRLPAVHVPATLQNSG